MSKLGVGGPFAGADQVGAARDAMKVALDAEGVAIGEARRAQEEAPLKSKGKASAGAAIMAEEMKNPNSRVDWARFKALTEGGPEAIAAAERKFKALWPLESAIIELTKMLPSMQKMDTVHTLDYFYPGEAREQYQLRNELAKQIAKIEGMLEQAGECSAVANFPKGQLAALRVKLEADLAALVAARGPDVTKPAFSYGSYNPMPPKPVFADPTPAQQLPARVALSPAEVTKLEDSAKLLSTLLKDPGLEALVLQAEALVLQAAGGVGKRAGELIRALGGYTLLADEAVTAPDYPKENPFHGPDRAHYRARKHSAWVNKRNEISRTELRERLVEALASNDPVEATKTALVELFVKEIGISANEARRWKPNVEAVIQALEGEALIPLRYMNSYNKPDYKYQQVFPQMKDLFTQLSQAFTEGRYEEWKAGLHTGEVQLRSLTPEGKKAWAEGMETAREIKDSKGNPVTLTTHEARGVERLWVTKNHTGSHGFDHFLGTPCLLAYLTNARTEAIIVDDPRWPQHAGRMYMRLLEDKNGKPVMFVESMAKDNEYPCSDEAEKTLLLHAMKKAKAVGAQLIISGYASDTVKAMKLEGEWKPSHQVPLVVTPTPLIEATVALQTKDESHDWVHQRTNTRFLNRDPFIYAGD